MLEITKEELMQMILIYFTDEVESCPLNAQAFVDVVFSKYQQDSCPVCKKNLVLNQGSQWCESCDWRGWVCRMV